MRSNAGCFASGAVASPAPSRTPVKRASSPRRLRAVPTNGSTLTPALSALVAGVVDYAGLFPPAALGMADAVAAYASYLDDPARAMLGRFVAPVSRLREFDDAAAPLLPRGAGSAPWRLSALAGVDTTADIDLALRFNCRHRDESELGHAVIDALELKVSTDVEIEAAMSRMPAQLTPYFEIPITSDPRALVEAIRRAGGNAKARTGGVTADAFPTPHELARFIVRCRDAGVAFKLTAGLHHPLRGSYRLTYADGAPHGIMFGYLNALAAALLAWRGADERTIVDVLEARGRGLVNAQEDVLTIAGERFTVDMLDDARRATLQSFGSCSFREPVDELAGATLRDSRANSLSHS